VAKRDYARWTHVRIDRCTYERLKAWIARQEEAKATRGAAGELGRWDRMTPDQAIAILLERDARHKDRKRAYAKRKALRTTGTSEGG
jgi:hypothetical protein